MRIDDRLNTRRMRLSSKLNLTIFPLLLVPCLIGVVLWLRLTMKNIYEHFDDSASSQLNELSQHLIGNAELVENSAHVALSRRDFLEFCSGNMNADGLSLVKFSQNELQDMRYIFQSNPLIQKASFYFDNDDIYEIWPLIYHHDRLINTPYETIDLHGQRGRYLTNPLKEEISCCYAVYVDTTRVGILVLDISLQSFLEPLYEGYDEDDIGMVILPTGGGSFARQGVVLPNDKDTKSALPSDEMQFGGVYQVEFSSSGVEYYGACTYLPLLDSWAIVLTERESLMRGMQEATRIAVVLVLIIATVLWLLIQYVCRFLLRRLSVLEESMLRVQEGELQVRIAEREDGGDELDTLTYSFNRMLDKTELLMKENVERETAAKQAELNALQSQINSHFLYNALERIRMMAVVCREKELAETIVSLGSILRYHMTWKERNVTLREELACVTQYVFFSNATGGAKLNLDLEVDENLLECNIPKLCIQPLVENSIVHGLQANDQLTIRIYASCEKGMLTLFVEDTGIGIPSHRLAEINSVLKGGPTELLRSKGNGIGILNVHHRLVTEYGPGAGLHIDSIEGQWTRASLTLPYAGPELGGW